MATKSRFFRVATEGATTDGRAIEKKWIQQMAKNFDPKKYGARIWLEHYRGIAPDGLFKAYGDVLALEAREVEGGKLALFAQIEPLPELVAMTKAKQKIYTSIEVNPSFADTGEAYMTGLGVTDSPASLGTDVLTFAAQNPTASPFAGRKENAAILFSEAVEAALHFEACWASSRKRARATTRDLKKCWPASSSSRSWRKPRAQPTTPWQKTTPSWPKTLQHCRASTTSWPRPWKTRPAATTPSARQLSAAMAPH
mgnify:CR=1 FL=1